MQHFRGNHQKTQQQQKNPPNKPKHTKKQQQQNPHHQNNSLSETPMTNTIPMGDVTVMGSGALYCCYRIFTTPFLFSKHILSPCMEIFHQK